MKSWNPCLRRLSLLIAPLCLCACFSTASAQTPLLVPPFANPNLDILRSGRVDALLKLSDGRTLVDGLYDRLGSVERAGTTRLLADGSVDAAFTTATNANNALGFALDSQARVYVMTSTRVLRLLENGSSDTGFAVVSLSSGTFRKLQISADQLIVAGVFSSISGNARTNLAKFDLSGNLDTNWQPNPDGNVLALHAPGNGFIYVGGSFANIGGAARTSLARIALVGTGVADGHRRWRKCRRAPRGY